MGSESPVVELYDSSGNSLSVQNATAIPASTPGILFMGSDGTNSRYVLVDSSGCQILVGAGTAGTPAGGVISIQGVSGGTVIPISITGTNTISGTVTANQGSANTIGNSWPVEMTDGTNILGTVAHPIRIDPTGTTTQPISGTVTANAGTGNFAVVQATAANLNATVTANGNFNNASVSATVASPPASATYMGGSVTTAAPTYTTGQMNALSLTTAGALRIDGSAVTQPVSGTITANAGSGTFTVAGTVTSNQGTSPWVTNITQFGGSNVVTGTGAGGAGVPRVTVSNDSNILATQSGTWTENLTQVASNTVATAANGVQKVGIVGGTGTSLETTAGVIDHNLKNVGNSAVTTLAAGEQKVAVEGLAASGSALSGNPVLTAGSDGTNARTINTDSGGRIQVSTGHKSSFMASTNGLINVGTTAGTVNSIAYLFHPSSNTKRIEISRIEVCITNIATALLGPNGVISIRGTFISAENSSPGGSLQTIKPTDNNDSVSPGMVFRAGATGSPTRINGDLITWISSVNQGPYFVWEVALPNKPIVLRASVAEGFEIRTNVELATNTAPQISVFFYWSEE